MDDEDKKKLDRILALAEENNEYVRSVRKSQKTSQMWRAIYLVVTVALLAGSYYAIKPYIGTLSDAYSSVSGIKTSGLQIPTASQIQSYVDQMKAKQ